MGVAGVLGRLSPAAVAVAAVVCWGVLWGALWGAEAGAQERSITIEDFDAEIAISDSAAVAVTETIRLRFSGEWQGIHRLIPCRSLTSRGENHDIRFRLLGVTDEAGTPLRVEALRERYSADLKIHLPGAANAVRTVVINYSLGRALKFFEDHDEFYWNVTGDEWPYPIGSARARISLPRAVENIRVNAFTGGYRSTERSVAIAVDEQPHGPEDSFTAAGESPLPPLGERHVVEVKATRALGIHEGLTVAVAWNPGAVRRPTAVENRWAWLVDNAGPLVFGGLVAGLPLAVFSGLFWLWWRRGRDPWPGPVVVQYEPPPGLGPAEVGTLVDNSPDNRDLMALLVDCAVRKLIRIRETSPAGWFRDASYAFDLLVAEKDWKDLPPATEALLRGLFKFTSGTWIGDPLVVCSVSSGDLANSFYVHLPSIRGAIFKTLLHDGHYVERPDHVRARYLTVAVGTGLAVAGMLFGLNQLFWHLPGESLIPGTVVSAVVSALIVAGFAFIMPARTAKGSRTRMAIRGFAEFLSRVDSHRLTSLPLTPELFERYLPYAMALGVEGRWAKAFEGICQEPPQWYTGTGPIAHFQTGDLTQSLSQMGAVTSQAMVSGPRSSEGSGFGGGGGSSGGGGWGGGGGSSGGGFGGGGGHGF